MMWRSAFTIVLGGMYEGVRGLPGTSRYKLETRGWLMRRRNSQRSLTMLMRPSRRKRPRRPVSWAMASFTPEQRTLARKYTNTRPMMASSTPDNPMASLLAQRLGVAGRLAARDEPFPGLHVAPAREGQVLRPIVRIGRPLHVGGPVDGLTHPAHEHGPVVAAPQGDGAHEAIDAAQELLVGVAHRREVLVAAQLEVFRQGVLALRAAQAHLELVGELEPEGEGLLRDPLERRIGQ